MKIYYKKDTGKIGTPKWGKLDVKTKKQVGQPMDYFTHFETKINYPEIDENQNEIPSGKSLIAFRFHTDADFCKWSVKEHVDCHGAIQVRYFIYDGIDKTEEQLIDWALSTPGLIANDGKTTIYNAKELK